MIVGARNHPLAFTLAGVCVETFPSGALFHPCTFTAASFGVETLVVRAGDLAGAFTLAGLEVE